jgi:hypothetical protein
MSDLDLLVGTETEYLVGRVFAAHTDPFTTNNVKGYCVGAGHGSSVGSGIGRGWHHRLDLHMGDGEGDGTIYNFGDAQSGNGRSRG